jgi:phage gp29-like protein
MIKSSRLKPGIELVDTNSFAGHHAYPAKNLSPERLAAIIRELDQGYCSTAMELFDEMEEKDIHLATVMQTRVLAAASKRRRVVPAGDSSDEKRCADFINDVWEGIEGKTQSLHDILSSIGRGFSVSEMMFEVVEGALVVSKIKFCPQRLFSFADFDSKMALPDFPYYFPFGKTKGEMLPREKFIFHANRATGLGALRGGLYRGLAWYFLFTNYTIKDWMSFMDIYGIPLRLGKFKPTADDSSKRVLKEAVKNLGADAAAVISEDTTIEFIESSLAGNHGLFENAVEFFNRQKSKRVLGQTLTTEQGKSGSYSLGNVHDRVRSDILQFDCAILGETLTRDFIVPLIKANFGEKKRYPRFVTDLDDRESKASRLDRLGTLYKMGLALPVAQLYEAAGIARPGATDEVVVAGKEGE